MAKEIGAMRLPVVASTLFELTSDKPAEGFCVIRTDSPGIARLAARHLLERGLRHFAFCGFQTPQWSIVRQQVFTQCVADEGFQCQACQLHVADWIQEPNWIQTWRQEQPLLERWLKSLPKPVGLMACNDACARVVLQACAAAGLRVPDDVAVVGVDNDELMCELSDPPLSSVALNLEESGYEAARTLDALMSGQSPPENVVLVKPTFVVTRRSSEVIGHDDRLVVTALRFIRDHAGQAIGVPDVVGASRVSRRTLERRFARGVGRSILSEVTRCRLERAKRLLLETYLPVKRVAAGSGFGSIKTFNRIFRRAEGQSATLFRHQSVADRLRQTGRNGPARPA
jgi:LacI family transcriptional regulator